MECKKKKKFTEDSCKKVLIETLWNVKQAAQAIPVTAVAGFNRNIVECKALFSFSYFFTLFAF